MILRSIGVSTEETAMGPGVGYPQNHVSWSYRFHFRVTSFKNSENLRQLFGSILRVLTIGLMEACETRYMVASSFGLAIDLHHCFLAHATR